MADDPQPLANTDAITPAPVADDDAPETILRPFDPTAGTGGVFTGAPYHFVFTGEDSLRIQAWGTAGVTINVAGRMLGEDDRIVPFSFALPLVSGYVRASGLFAPGRGHLLNVSVAPDSTTIFSGFIFARLEVVRGFTGALTTIATLLQGRILRYGALSWPGSVIEGWYEIPGFRSGATLANPAPAAPATFSPPTNRTWHLLGVSLLFDTSAAAGTRQPYVNLRIGTAYQAVFANPGTQGPGVANAAYFWASDYLNVAGSGLDARQGGLGRLGRIHSGYTIEIAVAGVQAGDQLHNIQLHADEFLDLTNA